MQDYEDDFDEDFISKSQLKREAGQLQALGERMVALKPEQLAQLDLPENLHDAVLEAHRIKSREASRRHRQYIGKLMRQVEIEPIEAQFDGWDRQHRAQTARLHQVENWRDRLLGDKDAVSELMQAHPDADVQRLRTLIRNAHKEQAANKPPKSARELFKALRDLLG